MSNMHTLETRTVINLLQEGPPSKTTVKRAIMLLIHLDAEIERLDAEIERFDNALKKEYIAGYCEGVKAAAARIRKDIVEDDDKPHRTSLPVYTNKRVDNLVEELTEGMNES